MADNIYLLETRLSRAQQDALAAVRDVAKSKGLTIFLVGGAVRDLIGGTAVRDLDVAVQGNALKLKKDIEKAGGVLAGEMESAQRVFARFPGGVRMEIGSTVTVTYPKPGKAVVKPATILEDLRRRDFTANAMALSLNDGSYGLLMDPLNGVADIENRELRLVSNYGFIEDPVRMIRAVRYMARLAWHMEEKTQSRYETGKAEGYIAALDEWSRGYETEEIFHEEDALRVMRRLEEEGWMAYLSPALSAAKANAVELERLRESQAQLQVQGVLADPAAASFPLLTAKMSAKEIEALKQSFPRQGFVREIEELEAKGKEFAAQLGAKSAAAPSQAYKLIMSAQPEAVLWAAHTTKSPSLQAKFKSFYTDWPQARQRIPYVQMQEMRITPELPEFDALVERLFFELMDGRLTTPEEIKAYLEPYSPPAPPPPVSLRRPRAPKKETKAAKSRRKAAEAAEDPELADEEAAEGETEEEGAEPAEAALVPEDSEISEEPGMEEPGMEESGVEEESEMEVAQAAGGANGSKSKGVSELKDAGAPAPARTESSATKNGDAHAANGQGKAAGGQQAPSSSPGAKRGGEGERSPAQKGAAVPAPAKVGSKAAPASKATPTKAAMPAKRPAKVAGRAAPVEKATPAKGSKPVASKGTAVNRTAVKGGGAGGTAAKKAPAKKTAGKQTAAKKSPTKGAASVRKAAPAKKKGR